MYDHQDRKEKELCQHMRILVMISKNSLPTARTKCKSLSDCITISQDWQGFPLNISMSFNVLLLPASDADTTGADMEDALSRTMRSICGRSGPPSTN